jgi:hypothetical protein
MKWLWIFWSGYGLYILYSVYSYFKGKSHVVNMDIYNTWFLKKIGIALGILAISILLRYLGKVSLAKWVAGVPAVAIGGWMLLGILAWLFTWFVMWIGGK